MRAIEYREPFADNKLKYDYSQHRYVLSQSFIASRYPTFKQGIDSNKMKELIEEVSDNVYLYIYSHKTGIENYDKMEYELAKNQYYREWLAEALIRQFEYAVTTSGDTVHKQHGIDINNDKTIDIASLRNELFVSYKTILILQQHGFLEMTVNNTNYTDEKWRVDY